MFLFRGLKGIWGVWIFFFKTFKWREWHKNLIWKGTFLNLKTQRQKRDLTQWLNFFFYKLNPLTKKQCFVMIRGMGMRFQNWNSLSCSWNLLMIILLKQSVFRVHFLFTLCVYIFFWINEKKGQNKNQFGGQFFRREWWL